jgi:hypothetical protein
MLIDEFVRVFGSNLPIFALLFIGVVVEKHYVSRVTVFTNVLALNMSFLGLDKAPRLLVWYGDLGLVLGVYGMLAYLLNVKTWWGYNAPAFFAYASLPVAAVVLASPGDWWIALLVGGVVNAVIGWVLSSELNIPIVHWGPRPGPVSRFIKTARMTYPDGMVTRKVDLDLGKFERR